LPGARRDRPQKTLELGEVADLAQGTHVPLDMGLDVAGVPEMKVASGIRHKLGVAASKESLPEILGRQRLSGSGPAIRLPYQRRINPARSLSSGHRQQVEDRRTPGERLGDPFVEEQVLGSGEQELSGPAAVFVDEFLDVGEQAGYELDLVVDDGRRKAGEKGPRVSLGGRPNVGRLEGDVAVAMPEQVLQQGRLSGLSRAGQHDGRKLRGGSLEDRLQGSADIFRHGGGRLGLVFRKLAELHFKCKYARKQIEA